MPTPVQISSANNKWVYEGEFTIGASGAITNDADGFSTTDPEITVVKAATGTYTLTIRGNFKKTLAAEAWTRAATPVTDDARVTDISLGGGAATAFGESTTTVTIKSFTATVDTSDAGAAADPTVATVANLASGSIIGFRIAFIKQA